MMDIQEQMKAMRICVVVPTYNNAGTIVGVLQRILAITNDVIVVIDGCTDDTQQRLETIRGELLSVVDYMPNRGKGHALVEGFKRAISKGFEYAITIDSDGQHFPEDIPLFVEALRQQPHSLVVGARNLHEQNMPGGNLFANKFSNFWFFLQTGVALPDTQTGYRLYPLNRLRGTQWITSRYEAELELLVNAAWRSVPIRSIPVRVYYPPQNERVSHFKPVVDFMRISLLNTALCILAVVYGWPRMLIHRVKHRKERIK